MSGETDDYMKLVQAQVAAVAAEPAELEKVSAAVNGFDLVALEAEDREMDNEDRADAQQVGGGRTSDGEPLYVGKGIPLGDDAALSVE